VSVLYADTSAILRAYFADEQEHETLRSQLLEGDEPVVTSEITRLEVASAATASARAGRIADPAVVLAAFDADCGDDGPITLLALEPKDALTRAVDLVQQQRLRSLDAIHVAVALSVVHLIAAEDLGFVTCDHAQGVAATALGLTVR
jgi:predicted nucleic acid-binding protein